VKAAVIRKLGSAPDVTASQVGQTDVVDISATSTDGHRAATIANAYANSYVDLRRTQAVNSLLAAAQQIQARVDDLNNQATTLDRQAASTSGPTSAASQSISAQRTAVEDQLSAFKTQLAQLQVNSAIETGAAVVATPATAPSSPSSPQIVRNSLVAAAVGLFLGIGLAFLRDYFDDSVKSKEDLVAAGGGLPVLGMIPAVRGWKRKSAPRVVSLTDPTSAAAESYRTLRTSIQFLGVDRPVRRFLITSPSAVEGKTATAANLGVALASAGHKVAVVGCDLRRPRIHDFFGLSNDVGFTSVLLGQLSVSEACQQVPGVEGLTLLASGPVPVNPSELLVSNRTGEVLDALQCEVDLLLLDCPPVLPVTDAAALSSRVDAALLVALAGTTTGRVVRQALEILTQVSAPVVGTVLNGVTAEGAYGYAYNYRYYHADAAALAINGSGGHTNGDVGGAPIPPIPEAVVARYPRSSEMPQDNAD
jgi:capsular exopolysaccharide synthesis family protein